MKKSMKKSLQHQPMGPEPTLLSRKEVDALYETMGDIVAALKQLNERDERAKIDYIVTGGSLLGAIRQHGILFCDDDIDIAILDAGRREHERVSDSLQSLLGSDKYQYSIRPWEGGDRVRHKTINTVFVDIFTIRCYPTMQELVDVLSKKKNGQLHSDGYVKNILDTIQTSAVSQGEVHSLFPLWHFNTRKAIEMWPKEVYRHHELFPLQTDLKMGPLTGIKGPRMPVSLLKRAFGQDCFHVYYQSASHKGGNATATTAGGTANVAAAVTTENGGTTLKPLVLGGGTWEGGQKVPLKDELYIPMMPVAKAKRRLTGHDKVQLMLYLAEQSQKELEYQNGNAAKPAEENGKSLQNSTSTQDEILLRNNMRQPLEGVNDCCCNTSHGRCSSSPPHQNERHPSQMQFNNRPDRTVYMDGVFDLFHIGHLEAIRQCAELGNRVILGVTGDDDATSYKRAPIICQAQRTAIVAGLRHVDKVVCPCPLIVTEDFMTEHGIDLVVHGFANDADAERQYEFFEHPIQTKRFQRISYYKGLSTSDIIQKIKNLDVEELP